VFSVGNKSQTQSNFDTEKSVWYYQPKIYIDKKDDNSLYEELKEFRLSLSEDVENEVITEDLNTLFEEDYSDEEIKRTSGEPKDDFYEHNDLSDPPSNSEPFSDGKFELLKSEIEDINRNIAIRVSIGKCIARCIESEKKILRQKLHELYTWTTGDKATVETVRMELTRLLCGLNREKRANKLNLWKDKVVEKRDRRKLLFEYKSICWMNGISVENRKERKK